MAQPCGYLIVPLLNVARLTEKLGIRPELFRKYWVKLPRVIFRQKTYDEVVSKNHRLMEKKLVDAPMEECLGCVEQALESIKTALEEMDNVYFLVKACAQGDFPDIAGNVEIVKIQTEKAKLAVEQADTYEKIANVPLVLKRLADAERCLFMLQQDVEMARADFESSENAQEQERCRICLRPNDRISRFLGGAYNSLMAEKEALGKRLSDSFLSD